MEALLSLAFDNLSSYDGPKIRKGLRQVEGLLAQICLSNGSSGRGRSTSTSSPTPNDYEDASGTAPRKDLAQLTQDPAFREFFKLQEGFEWNVAMRLVGTLDRLMAKGSDGQNDLLILSALDLIQGVTLLHPPSKSLFAREQNMNVRGNPSKRRREYLSSLFWLALIGSSRTIQLPSDSVSHPPDPGGRSHRHSEQHTHFRRA